jgi:hypothetical protein
VNDAKDPQREAHFQEWKKRVEEVKDQGNVKKQQKAGEKANEPAGPFGKGGGKQ